MDLHKERWRLEDGGGIVWDLQDSSTEKGLLFEKNLILEKEILLEKEFLPHEDHLEMSGEYVSQHILYRVDENKRVSVKQTLVWPWLRMIPNDTHGSMKTVQTGLQSNPEIIIKGGKIQLFGKKIIFDGILKIYEGDGKALECLRSYYPSPDKKGAFLKMRLKNISNQKISYFIGWEKELGTNRGIQGIYVYESFLSIEGEQMLNPLEEKEIFLGFTACFLKDKPQLPDGCFEERKRKEFLQETGQVLNLMTPDPALNQAFAFAKIRSMESIFRTKGGLLHSPGGLHYYAAIWTNDQAEYTNPFFAFTGMAKPVESAILCYRLFQAFMGPEYKTIPSSIIAEGLDIWEGKGDRGDAAMYAYGASRFLLTLGRRDIAEELFEAVVWCLEYCERNKTEDGVIRSDSDELEGRFPSGETNLATSCLTYEALRTGAILARELGDEDRAKCYEKRYQELGMAIEAYFGRELSGFQTYRYCESDEKLRSWICIPLTTRLFGRKEGTMKALMSTKLWTEDGLATREGDKTFWDRSTLYALRGMFAADEGDIALKYLQAYSRRRIFGEHVPYPVEAYPEGNQRHLSAESALYCRIFLEGIFGLSPAGLEQFICHPSLPETWHEITLKGIQYGGVMFDLQICQKPQEDIYEICMKDNCGERVVTCRRGDEVIFRIHQA